MTSRKKPRRRCMHIKGKFTLLNFEGNCLQNRWNYVPSSLPCWPCVWHNSLHEACTSTNFAHNFQVSHFQCESAWAIHSLLRMANVWNVSFRAYIIIQLIKAHYLIIPPLPPTNASPQFLQKLASYIHLADVVPFWLFIVIIPLVLI